MLIEIKSISNDKKIEPEKVKGCTQTILPEVWLMNLE